MPCETNVRTLFVTGFQYVSFKNKFMTIKEFNEFKFFIKYSKYNDIFIQKIIEHLNLIPYQKEINLDSYSLEADTRTKFISAIKYIDCAELLPNKRISFNPKNTKTKFSFSIDSLPVYKSLLF